MTTVGAVLLLVGLLLLAWGTRQFLEFKRMTAAPFRGTGELATSTDEGESIERVSTEGSIVAPRAVRAPCSGLSCLYYEIAIDREWEKQASTQTAKRHTGSTRVTTTRGGSIFQLDDGTGPVTVDAREGVDAQLNQTHDERFPIGTTVPGEIQFGKMRVQTPTDLGQERTTAFRAVERIVPAQGHVYASGKLSKGVLGKPDGGLLVLSHTARETLLGGKRMRALAGLIGGALLTAGSIPAFLLRG